MPIQKLEGKDHSSTPEGSDLYRYGGFYYFLRTAFMYAPQFTTEAYFPHCGGMKTVTNKNTSNGGLRIVDGKNLREPDDSDLIFFDAEFLSSINLSAKRLKTRTEKDEDEPEVTGIYKIVNQEVRERINKEPSDENEE